MNKKDVILSITLVLAAILLVGGFIALKQHKDKVAPTPVAVIEEPIEEPEPEPEQTQPRRRQRRDINSSINRMVPVQGDQVQGMPTREEAVPHGTSSIPIVRRLLRRSSRWQWS